VLGNPCDKAHKLNEEFVQPFGLRKTTLAQEAAEVFLLFVFICVFVPVFFFFMYGLSPVRLLSPRRLMIFF
jgi:hypothetical protein